MKNILLIVFLASGLWAVRDLMQRDIEHPPGVLVAETPNQKDLDGDNFFQFEDYRLTRRAEFDIRARVLSKEKYYLGKEADLSPLDLALGWGAMSDQAVLDRMEISQGARWFITRWDDPAPISERAMMASSGNMHMIPAEKRIGKQMNSIRGGDIIRLRGYLVDVDHASGWYWRTSMSRDDTGGGACEIVYVESVEIETRP